MTTNNYPPKPILLVDDEPAILNLLAEILQTRGFNNVLICGAGQTALSILERQEVALALLDMNLPDLSGMEILTRIKADFPQTPVIILTAMNDLSVAVECMKMGASDYLVKPFDPARLLTAVKLALELSDLQHENRLLQQKMLLSDLEHPDVFSEIITQDPKLKVIFKYIEAVALTTQPILITGETGVGKELAARAIHTASRRPGALITINAASLDDTVFSDTLFGHVRGAFTGAMEPRAGLIEKAAGGTLFLDEIGEISDSSQVKLLRLVQEREYLPIGSDQPRMTDARVITATNRNIQDMKQGSCFRKELYFRLCTHQIHIPPLRERHGDLPLLVNLFLCRAVQMLGKKKPLVPKELLMLLSAYHFPGNVRELESMVTDAVTAHRGTVLSMEKFRLCMRADRDVKFCRQDAVDQPGNNPTWLLEEKLPTLKQAREMLVAEAVKRANGNQNIAAGLLGISRQALNKKIKKKSGCKTIIAKMS